MPFDLDDEGTPAIPAGLDAEDAPTAPFDFERELQSIRAA